jgi:hypothetical protein
MGARQATANQCGQEGLGDAGSRTLQPCKTFPIICVCSSQPEHDVDVVLRASAIVYE